MNFFKEFICEVVTMSFAGIISCIQMALQGGHIGIRQSMSGSKQVIPWTRAAEGAGDRGVQVV